MDDLDHGPEQKPKRSGRDESRLAAIVVLAVLGTAFALENRGKAKINYVFGSGHPRQIFVIVFCIAIGVGLGWFAGRRRAAKKD
jgi:uncharacterized integral membrane protein